jgi:hypothetical protein
VSAFARIVAKRISNSKFQISDCGFDIINTVFNGGLALY